MNPTDTEILAWMEKNVRNISFLKDGRLRVDYYDKGRVLIVYSHTNLSESIRHIMNR